MENSILQMFPSAYREFWLRTAKEQEHLQEIRLRAGRPIVLQMDGREVFAFAVRQVPACITETLQKVQLTPGDVDLFVLHQANKRIIEGISKRLSVEMEKFPMNLDRVGNMSSAAIPVLLDELNREGRLREGMTLVLSGFGAGLTYGACALRW